MTRPPTPSEEALGDLIATYRERSYLRWGYLVFSLVLVGGSLWLAWTAVGVGQLAEGADAPARPLLVLWTVVVGLLAVACLGAGSLTLYLGVRPRRSIRHYAQGLVVQARRRIQVLPWASISALMMEHATLDLHALHDVGIGPATRTTHSYRLWLTTGAILRFDDAFPDVVTLGAAIEHATRPHLLATARAALAAGTTVAFGRVQVTANGVQARHRTLAWADVTAVRVLDERLAIYQRGHVAPWLRLVIAETPNVTVFLALVADAISPRVLVPSYAEGDMASHSAASSDLEIRREA